MGKLRLGDVRQLVLGPAGLVGGVWDQPGVLCCRSELAHSGFRGQGGTPTRGPASNGNGRPPQSMGLRWTQDRQGGSSRGGACVTKVWRLLPGSGALSPSCLPLTSLSAQVRWTRQARRGWRGGVSAPLRQVGFPVLWGPAYLSPVAWSLSSEATAVV